MVEPATDYFKSMGMWRELYLDLSTLGFEYLKPKNCCFYRSSKHFLIHTWGGNYFKRAKDRHLHLAFDDSIYN